MLGLVLAVALLVVFLAAIDAATSLVALAIAALMISLALELWHSR